MLFDANLVVEVGGEGGEVGVEGFGVADEEAADEAEEGVVDDAVFGDLEVNTQTGR